jgi:hypothetical protein
MVGIRIRFDAEELYSTSDDKYPPRVQVAQNGNRFADQVTGTLSKFPPRPHLTITSPFVESLRFLCRLLRPLSQLLQLNLVLLRGLTLAVLNFCNVTRTVTGCI